MCEVAFSCGSKCDSLFLRIKSFVKSAARVLTMRRRGCIMKSEKKTSVFDWFFGVSARIPRHGGERGTEYVRKEKKHNKICEKSFRKEENMLSISNFTKSYDGKKNAVTNLSFEVRGGDIFGFIGHNGAGKTTTIKACAGILEFDEGTIKIDGTDIKKDPLMCKKKVAYLPDNPDIYEFMSGIKYLNFIGDIFEVPKSVRSERITRYAEEFEIAGDLNSSVAAYSHGMKQKLAIIGSLLHEPKLLICDEPFVGLDPKAALVFKNYMREMCAKGGAVLFSTHVLEVAEKLCNRIAVIKGGELVAVGDIDEVKGTSSLEDVFMELTEK